MQLVNSFLIALAFAQAPQTAPPPNLLQGQQGNFVAEQSNSMQTREIFRQIVRQYSPTLGEVFRLDPALLTNQAFLAPYPRLAEFLKQHPEIAHNPSFYVGESYAYPNLVDTAEQRSVRMFEDIMAGIAAFTAGLIILSFLGWILDRKSTRLNSSHLGIS